MRIARAFIPKSKENQKENPAGKIPAGFCCPGRQAPVTVIVLSGCLTAPEDNLARLSRIFATQPFLHYRVVGCNMGVHALANRNRMTRKCGHDCDGHTLL